MLALLTLFPLLSKTGLNMQIPGIQKCTNVLTVSDFWKCNFLFNHQISPLATITLLHISALPWQFPPISFLTPL